MPCFLQTERSDPDARDVSNWDELVRAFEGTPRVWVAAAESV